MGCDAAGHEGAGVGQLPNLRHVWREALTFGPASQWWRSARTSMVRSGRSASVLVSSLYGYDRRIPVLSIESALMERL